MVVMYRMTTSPTLAMIVSALVKSECFTGGGGVTAGRS